MRTPGQTILATVLLLNAADAFAQARGDWVSYRDAYRQLVVFEKYGKPKQLLQSTLQVVPLKPGATLDGLTLTLAGRSTNLSLPLDATGRATVPLVKSAYDDNAILMLNQGDGDYAFRPRISIAVQADGVYEAAELRQACEQALGFERYATPRRPVGARCSGVRFAFTGQSADVKVRQAGQESALPPGTGPAFPDVTQQHYAIATYHFRDWSPAGQVITRDVPVSISAIFE